MEESSLRANVNFIKLNKEELSTKIALLVSENEKMILWKKSPRHYETQVISFNKSQNQFKITLKTENFYLNLNNEVVCLSFMQREMKYFIKGRVLSQDLENSRLEILLDDVCFRAEKRRKERLLTYPIYEVYAYLKYTKPEITNLVYFNKKEKQQDDFLAQIDNLERSKIQSLSQELELENGEDILGFRVEDISSGGLSLFASSKEVKKIEESIEQNKFILTLNFEGKIYNLENSELVYQVSYINSSLSHLPMFKIGIRFNQHQELKNLVEKQVGVVVDLEEFQKEFEEFIKNE